MTIVTLGPFRLDARNDLLWHGTEPVALGKRAIALLRTLVERPGELVSKDTLIEAAWPHQIVEENNLTVQIAALRQVLGSAPNGGRWIETMPRRGYRFVGPVVMEAGQSAPPLVAAPHHDSAARDLTPPAEAAAPPADKPSIAVLPFDNMSGDAAQDYFVDGMVEEIITALSRIRWLLVVPRNSSFTYKGRSFDMERAGRELGVRYVLRGSARKVGSRVRITAQLIEALSGENLWADRFDGSLEDIFDLQDRVASSVAGVIEPTLQVAEAIRSAGRSTADVTAYDLYLRASAMVASSSARTSEALGLLEQAIERDPAYGPALSGAAFCCYALVIDGRSDDVAADRRKGVDFARRALHVAADDPGILANAVLALGYFGEDIGAMMALVDRALALNPSYARGWHVSGILRLFAGQADLAIEHVETALRLSPRVRVGWALNVIGAAHFLSRRFDEAAPKLRLAIHEDPRNPTPYRFLAACYAHMGQLDDGRELAALLRAVTSVTIPDASFLRNSEQRELYISGLRQATGEGGDGYLEIIPRRGHAPIGSVVVEARTRITGPDLRSGTGSETAAAPAERRQITALSCELMAGSDRTEKLDLEDLRTVVTLFRNCVSETVRRHNGFVASRVGNTMLVLFGYPAASEHDSDRAVRAGLELCIAVRSLSTGADLPTRCRVGIATGSAIIGDLSGPDPLCDEIVSDALQRANQLQLSAQPDCVVIGPATRQLIGNLFDCQDLGAIDLMSGTEPLPIWRVLGASNLASRFEALRGTRLSPLIGRDDEIGLLLRRWERVKAGDGQIVLISGEAGLGKSRITAELETRLHSEPYLRLRYFCSPHHQDSALFPFIDQIGRAAEFARDDPPEARLEKLETLLAGTVLTDEDVAFVIDLLSLSAWDRRPLPQLSPQRKKERTLEALIRWLEGLAAKQPVVLVLEDTHWSDPTSRELLDLIVEHVRRLPVLLIVTFRPEFPPPWIGQPQVTMLALARLDRRDCAVLIEQIAGGKAAPDEVVAQLAERADGVPLFIEELTKSVLESGLLREERDQWVLDAPLSSFAIPTTLHASLLARLDRLPLVRQVAQIGAAIGRQFPYTLLRAVVSLPEKELRAALVGLVASELALQRGAPPDAVYSFKHALVQEAAYSTLLRAPRQQLHALIAEALELHFPELIENQPELLAQHYTEAGLIKKSVIYWRKAGHRSATRSAMAEAAAQLQKGLDQLMSLPDDLWRHRQELEFRSLQSAVLFVVKGHAAPETGDAHTRARELWELLDFPSEFLHVPYGQSRYHQIRGEFDFAQRLDDDLLRLSRQRNDTAGLVLGHYSSGRNQSFTGKFASSRLHLEEVLVLYDPASHRWLVHQTGHLRAASLGYLGLALFCLGFPDQALARANAAIVEARTLAHPPSLATALAKGARLISLVGDNVALDERARQLMAVATEQESPLWLAQGTIYRGWAMLKSGDFTAGEALLQQALATYRATGAGVIMPYYMALLAEACEVARRLEEAQILLDEALRITERTGEGWFLAELNRRAGRLLVRQGHSEAAEGLYYKALRIAREQEAKLWELRAAVSLARLCQDQGRRSEARNLLAPVYGWFTEGFETPDLKQAQTLLDA